MKLPKTDFDSPEERRKKLDSLATRYDELTDSEKNLHDALATAVALDEDKPEATENGEEGK